MNSKFAGHMKCIVPLENVIIAYNDLKYYVATYQYLPLTFPMCKIKLNTWKSFYNRKLLEVIQYNIIVHGQIVCLLQSIEHENILL